MDFIATQSGNDLIVVEGVKGTSKIWCWVIDKLWFSIASREENKHPDRHPEFILCFHVYPSSLGSVNLDYLSRVFTKEEFYAFSN